MVKKIKVDCVRCGKCCQTFISFIRPEQMTADTKLFFDHRNILYEKWGDGRYRILVPTIPCMHLKEDNLCSVHGTNMKPVHCKEGPFYPRMLPHQCIFSKTKAKRDQDGSWYIEE